MPKVEVIDFKSQADAKSLKPYVRVTIAQKREYGTLERIRDFPLDGFGEIPIQTAILAALSDAFALVQESDGAVSAAFAQIVTLYR